MELMRCRSQGGRPRLSSPHHFEGFDLSPPHIPSGNQQDSLNIPGFFMVFTHISPSKRAIPPSA